MTILIAARNAAATIERAVRSAAADPAVSIIVIDDHSTDDTVLARATCRRCEPSRDLRA